uniref:Uncharacterized protein n=1 Tax=Xenopus tropicalis TaxID=8364 RepID=A0A1B8XXQ8_XENTR
MVNMLPKTRFLGEPAALFNPLCMLEVSMFGVGGSLYHRVNIRREGGHGIITRPPVPPFHKCQVLYRIAFNTFKSVCNKIK